MSGWLKIIGIGPGSAEMITPEVSAAITHATDAVGYIPYIDRLAHAAHLKVHPSDNRVERERAELAFALAHGGKRVLVVSSGDPGVFAMASAVFEVLEEGPQEWRLIDIEVLPGITAMLAAAAALGAPLGHDFCAINLSDHLKPWDVIERRLRHAARGDFAMGFYNPRSKTRPHGFGKALGVLREECQSDPPMMFCRNVSRKDQSMHWCRLSQATPEMADMRTAVLLGNSQTRVIEAPQKSWLYTPRFYAPV